jgi:hypothetical protein
MIPFEMCLLSLHRRNTLNVAVELLFEFGVRNESAESPLNRGSFCKSARLVKAAPRAHPSCRHALSKLLSAASTIVLKLSKAIANGDLLPDLQLVTRSHPETEVPGIPVPFPRAADAVPMDMPFTKLRREYPAIMFIVRRLLTFGT